MQESVWLGKEAQDFTRQLAQRRLRKAPVIPIITEISVLPNSSDIPIRNIDLFNLQDALIERLRADISHSRIATEQWVGFDRARGATAGSAQIRVYMRNLLTTAELSVIDNAAHDLAGGARKFIHIGFGPGAVIDFRFHPFGRDGGPHWGGWRDLAPLIRPPRRAGAMVRPKWLLRNKTGMFRDIALAALKPDDVNGYLKEIERGSITAPHNAMLGLALVSGADDMARRD